MEYDLNGGDKTGFNPYIKEGQICFDHRWLLLIGKRKTNPHLSRKRNFQFDGVINMKSLMALKEISRLQKQSQYGGHGYYRY